MINGAKFRDEVDLVEKARSRSIVILRMALDQSRTKATSVCSLRIIRVRPVTSHSECFPVFSSSSSSSSLVEEENEELLVEEGNPQREVQN